MEHINSSKLGFNNVFDEDPPICFPCGLIERAQFFMTCQDV